jgi:hypothetical protein
MKLVGLHGKTISPINLPVSIPLFFKRLVMELISTLAYKGYTIKTFATSGNNLIKIYLGDDPIDYNSDLDEQYEGSVYEKDGMNAAKQHIDEREEKENSL